MSGPVLPSRPLLVGLYHVVSLGPDRVQICNAGRSVVLAGAGLSDQVVPFLADLDGTHTVDDLRGRYPSIGDRLLVELTGRGFLVAGDPLRDPANTTATGLAAVSDPGALAHGPEPAPLNEATISVAGCGPVAGAAAVMLARSGVARIVLADEGPVTSADIASSPVLALSAAGRRRSEAVGALCRQASSCTVECVEAITGTAADLALIEWRYTAEGRLPGEADAALAAGVPFLVHGQDGLEALVGPLVRPGGDPCHRCVESRRLSHVSHLDEHVAYLRHRSTAAPAPDAFLAGHSALVAGTLVVEALRALVGLPGPADPAVVVIDLSGPEVRYEPVLALPGCPACQSAGAHPVG